MEKKLKYIFKGNVVDIFFVRHPEVENFLDNVFNGSMDVGLSDRGFKQSEVIFECFKNRVDVVYTSPLKRCRIVAEKFSGLVDVFVDERLRERSFGVFESLSWQQIEERYPEAARDFIKDPFNYKPEGGESFAEVESRVKDFLCDLLSINRNTLIVAHGGINRIFIELLLNMDETAVLKLSQDYACVNHFQTDGKFVLAKLINGQVCFDRCI